MTAPALHICHVTGAFLGGTFHSVRQLANGQADLGHAVSVVHNVVGPLPDGYRQQFRPQVRLVPWPVARNLAPVRDLLAQHRLLRIVARLHPSILHLHCSKAGLAGRIAGRLLGVPHVYSPRGLAFCRTDVSAASRSLFRWLERLGSAMGGVTVACSRDEEEAVSGLAARYCTIPNGLDLEEVDAMLRDGTLDRADPRFHVVMSGRITPARNPALVVRLAAASPPSWRWSWIGDGEERARVEACPRIAIVGWRSRAEMLGLLRQADVFLHPSLWEGMPLAVLEAMAAELPVVASNIMGNRDLVEPGRSGALIDRETDYLPELARLAADPDLRRRLGRAGRLRLESCHDMRRLNHEWIDLYRTECARATGAMQPGTRPGRVLPHGRIAPLDSS